MLPIDSSEEQNVPPSADAPYRETSDNTEHHHESLLNELLPEDHPLYEALEHFLLADPERQIGQLGGSTILDQKGREGMEKGDKSGAAVNFDYAAKIEIYKQNKEATKRYLELADKVTDTDKDHQFHTILLSDLDEVMRVSGKYQESNRQNLETR